AANDVLRKREQRRHLLFRIFDQRRSSKHDHRTVVHRVMKRRASQHQAVEQRHRHTRIDTARERPQHAARLRTMDVKLIFNARETRRYDDGLAVDSKTDMTNKTFVQYS